MVLMSVRPEKQVFINFPLLVGDMGFERIVSVLTRFSPTLADPLH